MTHEKMASPLDFNPSPPQYWSADSQDALLVPTSTPSCPNSLVPYCAFPSITTIPYILALGMPSAQPPSVLRQVLHLHVAYFHVPTIMEWIHDHQPLIKSPDSLSPYKLEQFQQMRLSTLPLNPGLVKRLPYPMPLGISIS